jgi:hypothetical protein
MAWMHFLHQQSISFLKLQGNLQMKLDGSVLFHIRNIPTLSSTCPTLLTATCVLTKKHFQQLTITDHNGKAFGVPEKTKPTSQGLVSPQTATCSSKLQPVSNYLFDLILPKGWWWKGCLFQRRQMNIFNFMFCNKLIIPDKIIHMTMALT